MEPTFAFKPAGPVHFIIASGNTPSGTKILGPDKGGEMEYLIVNPANSPDVIIGYGPTSDVAVSNAGVIPIAGGTMPGSGASGASYLPGGSIHVFTYAPGMFVAPRTISGSCTINVTMGVGL